MEEGAEVGGDGDVTLGGVRPSMFDRPVRHLGREVKLISVQERDLGWRHMNGHQRGNWVSSYDSG